MTNRTTPTTLQGCMQARPPGTWYKHRLLGSYCHRQRCLETHSKRGVITIQIQRLKVEETRLHKKTACLANRPTTPFTCSKCGRDCHFRIGFQSHNRRCKMGANLCSFETDRCQWYIHTHIYIHTYTHIHRHTHIRLTCLTHTDTEVRVNTEVSEHTKDIDI